MRGLCCEKQLSLSKLVEPSILINVIQLWLGLKNVARSDNKQQKQQKTVVKFDSIPE